MARNVTLLDLIPPSRSRLAGGGSWSPSSRTWSTAVASSFAVHSAVSASTSPRSGKEQQLAWGMERQYLWMYDACTSGHRHCNERSIS